MTQIEINVYFSFYILDFQFYTELLGFCFSFSQIPTQIGF